MTVLEVAPSWEEIAAVATSHTWWPILVLATAIDQIKAGGMIAEEHVRLCVIADWAAWIWKQ